MTVKHLMYFKWMYWWISVVCTMLLLGACQRYSVAVNENVVYEPPPLFSDFSIDDAAFNQCVRAAIAEQDITRAKQLTQLSCPAGQIHSISGVQVFSHLKRLGIKDNKVTDIKPLLTLQELQHVDLRNNSIVDVSPLRRLPKLKTVKLGGNASLTCATLPKTKSLSVEPPEHCATSVQTSTQ